MFDAGIKETLCARCAHYEVCSYKQDYLDILKAVENATVTSDTPDGKITSKKVVHYDFISDISVKCKFHQWLRPACASSKAPPGMVFDTTATP